MKGPGVPGLPLPWGLLRDRNHFVRSKPAPQIHTVARLQDPQGAPGWVHPLLHRDKQGGGLLASLR